MQVCIPATAATKSKNTTIAHTWGGLGGKKCAASEESFVCLDSGRGTRQLFWQGNRRACAREPGSRSHTVVGQTRQVQGGVSFHVHTAKPSVQHGGDKSPVFSVHLAGCKEGDVHSDQPAGGQGEWGVPTGGVQDRPGGSHFQYTDHFLCKSLLQTQEEARGPAVSVRHFIRR